MTLGGGVEAAQAPEGRDVLDLFLLVLSTRPSWGLLDETSVPPAADADVHICFFLTIDKRVTSILSCRTRLVDGMTYQSGDSRACGCIIGQFHG